MATTNPVFQVLTSSGNQAILAAGSRVDSLQHGQIGIFNYHTGLSVDGSVPGDARDIFIAVGINRASGAGAMDDLLTSAGQVIQVRNARALTVKGTVDEIQKVVELWGFKASCESDYAVKIEFRNQKSYGMNGYNQFAKTYNYFTGCCADPCGDGCGAGNNIELAVGLRDAINNDTDKLVVASLFAHQIQGTIGDPTTDGTAVFTVGTETFSVALLAADTATQAAAKIAAAINAVATSAYTASSAAAVLSVYPKTSAASDATVTIALSSAGGTGVTLTSVTAADVAVTDDVTFKATNPGAGVGLRITGVAQTRPSFNGDININYYGSGTDFVVTPVTGFECNGTVKTITELQYKEGNGYDLKQLEYEAGGFNGKPGPYRQSELTGLARQGFESFVSLTANYNVVSLEYDQMSVGGWLEYLNNLQTIIVIPCADTTTLTGLFAVLDLIFTQFQPMSNDVASMDCTNGRVGLLTPATDGIESLS